VLVADGGSTDGTLEICEDCGAEVVAGGLAEAVALARCEWVLILPVDLKLRRGWDAAVVAHLEQGGATALLLDASESGKGIGGWFRQPKAGVLLRREAAMAGDLSPAALSARYARRAPRLS
jgi:hypothetical protein